MAVYLAQCLCPQRHCIMALADEHESDREAEKLRGALRGKVFAFLKSGALRGWCALCGADRATWRYEVGATGWETTAEALEPLRQLEAEQVLTNAIWGDLDKRQRPN